MPKSRLLLLALLLLFVVGSRSDARAQAEPFEVERFHDPGRTILGEIVDLDGDGRRDLLQAVMRGIPPEERRVIRVRLQRPNGSLPAEPDFELSMPERAAAYDLADLRDAPGTELVLLRPHDVLILSLAAADAPRWSLKIDRGTTVGAAHDERGIERLRMAFDSIGPELRLLVPLFGEMLVLSPEGETLSAMAMPSRANYYIPPNPGFYFGESDMQLFYDAPRVSLGDIDGDGRTDLAAANRHEVRVFLQAEDGGFPRQADRVTPLALVSEKDHIRGSGGVTAEARDFDADGRLDLLVSHVAGSFADARTTTTAYLNRGGEWDRDNPVGTIQSRGAIAGDLLVDLEGDGRPELLRSEITMSVLEMVELLVTRAADARVRIYPFVDGHFAVQPSAQLKLDIPISFDTFRTAGFLPHVHVDVNGDGKRDLLLGGKGEAIEVRLGGHSPPFSKTDAYQEVDTSGELRVGDLEGDGLDDLLIFTPQRPGTPLRLLRNRGMLPGTAPSLVAPRER